MASMAFLGPLGSCLILALLSVFTAADSCIPSFLHSSGQETKLAARVENMADITVPVPCTRATRTSHPFALSLTCSAERSTSNCIKSNLFTSRLRGGSQDGYATAPVNYGGGSSEVYTAETQPGQNQYAQDSITQEGANAGHDEVGPIALHDGWYQYFDEEQGLPYYYNVETGVTEWEMPEPNLVAEPHQITAQPADAPSAPPEAAGQHAGPYAPGAETKQPHAGSMPADETKNDATTAERQGLSKPKSSLKLAGLDIMDSTQAGILRSYMGGLFSDGVSAIVNSVTDVTSKLADFSTSNANQLASALDPKTDGCGAVREEWQVAQGKNEKGALYTTFRHRKYGTVVELYEESQGSFSFVVSDEALPEVCYCMAITDFVVEKRDYLFHPMLTDQLRRDSDNDAHSLLRYPQIPAGRWHAEGAHQGVLLAHKGKYEKNKVAIFLIPDGFVFVSRGNINHMDAYRNRQALIVRQGMCYEVQIQDAKQLILQTLGPVLDLTHFRRVNATTLPSYEHLLEEGERIRGHDKSLEETWRLNGTTYNVFWEAHFVDYSVERGKEPQRSAPPAGPGSDATVTPRSSGASPVQATAPAPSRSMPAVDLAGAATNFQAVAPVVAE